MHTGLVRPRVLLLTAAARRGVQGGDPAQCHTLRDQERQVGAAHRRVCRDHYLFVFHFWLPLFAERLYHGSGSQNR